MVLTNKKRGPAIKAVGFIDFLCWWQVIFAVTFTLEALSLLWETDSPFWAFSWSLFDPAFSFFAARFSIEFGNVPGAFSCLIVTAALYALALTGLLVLSTFCFQRRGQRISRE